VIELLMFQINASSTIADRFAEYMADPLTITRTNVIPFYQNKGTNTRSRANSTASRAAADSRFRRGLKGALIYLGNIAERFAPTGRGHNSSALRPNPAPVDINDPHPLVHVFVLFPYVLSSVDVV